MNKYNYTVMKGKDEVVSLDDIKLAHKALDEPGKGLWIRYNAPAIADFIPATKNYMRGI